MTKKSLSALLLAMVLLCSFFCMTAEAAETQSEEDYEYIFEDRSYLSTTEQDALENKSDRLYDKYGYTVAYVLVHDYSDYGCYDIEQFAEYLTDELSLSKKTVILVVSMYDRSYDLYATDGASEAFESNAIGYYIEDAIVERLREDDWYGAGQVLQEKCSEFLEAYENGKPVRAPKITPVRIVVILGGGLLAALIVCSILKAQMKSARIQTNADNYVIEDSFNLTRSADTYTHTTETRRKIETENHSHGGRSGGGGGSHHSGHF